MEFGREIRDVSFEQLKSDGGHRFLTEMERRERLNALYKSLRSLLPNPIKTDRAALVGYTIIYIKDLKKAVNTLKERVEEKRCEGSKRLKLEESLAINMKRLSIKPIPLDGFSRSSWQSRKSKEAIIDVQIVDNELNIKLTQRKKGNCLLLVANLLNELQLELHYATGGKVGDHHIFMFNAKIGEDSSASAIARKMNELLDKEFPIFSRL